MDFRQAARHLCSRISKKLPLIFGLGAALATSACGPTLSSLGFIGMDDSLNQRFTAICSDMRSGPTVVYRDNAHNGDRYRVRVQGQRRAHVEASVKNYTVQFSGYYDGGSNGNPGNTDFFNSYSMNGVTLDGTRLQGFSTRPPEGGYEMQIIHDAAFKALDDINFKRVLPGRPCENMFMGGAYDYAVMHPGG